MNRESGYACYIGKFRAADEEIDLKLRLDPAWLEHPETALQVPVLQHPSGPVHLGDIVQPRPVTEPGELHRYQKQRSLTITANISTGAPISTPVVVAWVNNWYQEVRDRYPGATITFGGEFEETRRSYTSLTYAFGLALLLIYLILATQFRSYLQPLIIISAVVFSIIGVVFGKLVTQSLFTVNSFIAVVGVTGVVVNDALVLMPMALGIPGYSVVWGSMASTFVTGLATATFLTLFIVPVEWDLLTGLRERREKRRPPARRPDIESA